MGTAEKGGHPTGDRGRMVREKGRPGAEAEEEQFQERKAGLSRAAPRKQVGPQSQLESFQPLRPSAWTLPILPSVLQKPKLVSRLKISGHFR